MAVRRFFRFFKNLNGRVLKYTIAEIGRQRLFGLSSEIAFNAMLAMFPTIIAAIAVLGQFFPERAAFDLITQNLRALPPEEVQNILDRFVNQLQSPKTEGIFSIGFVAALWIASAAVSSIMNALDRIHRVPKHCVRPFWKSKLVSIGLTIGTILMLTVASFLAIVSDFIIGRVVGFAGEYESNVLAAWHRLSWPIALMMVALAFAVLYRLGVSRWKPGTPVLPGATVAAILWAVVSSLFRLYVSRFGSYNVYYGAVGAAIVLLLWLKWSSLALLIGAQLNVVVGRAMRQSPISKTPPDYTVKESPESRDSVHWE